MLHLDDSLLLGKGLHKAAWRHPEDDSRCIKIPYKANDAELRHELQYRRSRQRRRRHSRLLTAYYGTVETDRGLGYVFERVMDYDGSDCETLGQFLARAEAGEVPLAEAGEVLQRFRQEVFRDKILTNDTCLVNFLLQQQEPGKYAIRIIDNIGSPVQFPLLYYLDFLADRHMQRWWKRFCRRLLREHPALLTDELRQELCGG